MRLEEAQPIRQPNYAKLTEREDRCRIETGWSPRAATHFRTLPDLSRPRRPRRVNPLVAATQSSRQASDNFHYVDPEGRAAKRAVDA